MAKNTKKAPAAKPLAQTEPVDPLVPRWTYFAAFFLPFLSYLLTAAHSVTFEDSGVFIGAATSLGLPQPPGYPLYTLIAWLFSHLPIDTVAYRIHMFSALCSSGAVLFFYCSAKKLFKAWQPALVAALFFGWADTMWSQAIVAEVYPLHIFLFSVLFYLTLRIVEIPSRKNLLLFGLVYGLALANHWPLLILGSPIFLAFAWSQRREILRWSWVWLPTAVGVASVFYVFMMWRSQQDPAVSFLGPLESVNDLWSYITRKYYRTIEEKWDSRFVDKLLFFADGVYAVLWREWYLAGAFVATGVAFVRQYFNWPQRLGLLFAFLATTFFLTFTITFEFNDLNQNVMKVFHLVPIYVAATMMVGGMMTLQKRWGSKVMVVSVSLVVIAFIFNFLKNDLREDRFAENYARFVLDAIPQKETSQALIAGTDADVGPLAYVRVSLGERPDLRLYTQSGVFFRDRLFDPHILRSKVRYEKIENFIKKEGIVYSTKSVDVFESAKNLPFTLQYNGLFYEISSGFVQPLTFGPEFTERAKAILDDYARNPRHANWYYHRETIASRLCNYIILRDPEFEQHPIWKSSRACRQIMARHYAKLKKYREADLLFKDLIDSATWMISAERHLIRYHRLVNELERINAEPGTLEEKKAKVLIAVNDAKAGLTEYPHCGNSVYTVLESLKNQVRLPDDVIRNFALFKKCKKKDEKKSGPHK